MRPTPFVDLLAEWTKTGDHPALRDVWAGAYIGRPVQPYSLIVGLDHGWTAVVQVTAASPPQADPSTPPVLDEEALRRGAATFADAQKAATPLRGGQPPIGEQALLHLLLDTIKTADHFDVADAHLTPVDGYADPSRSVTVMCADGYRLYCFVAGFLPPGHAEFPHAVRDIPKAWR